MPCEDSLETIQDKAGSTPNSSETIPKLQLVIPLDMYITKTTEYINKYKSR